MTTIACSVDIVEKIVNWKKEDMTKEEDEQRLHRMANIVCFDNVSNDLLQRADEVKLRVTTYDQVLEEGEKALKDAKFKIQEPHPDDVCLFSYTSGTTGDPKGVKLSHEMFLMSG